MSNRTLFIHTPKAAGTTIASSCPVVSVSERYLNENKIKEDRMNPKSYYTLNSPQSFIKHAPYSYLDKHKISRFDRVFTTVRNPWSRLVSMYHHADSISHRINKTWYHQDKISWDEYLNRMDSFRMNSSYYWNHPYDQWGIQLDWISIGSKVKCDVLRYENLQEDVNTYFDTNITLNKDNAGNYNHNYKEYYTKDQRQKVADWFRLDIEYFGFTFESGATRNYWRLV